MNSKMTSGKLGSNKNTSLKIFGASESSSMDKTPTNCIPRLCTLTVSKMVLTKPINVELSSVYLVIKMAQSRRTIRSSEININSSSSPVTNKELMNESLDCTPTKQHRQAQVTEDPQSSSGEQPETPKEHQQPNQPQAATSLKTIQNTVQAQQSNDKNTITSPVNEQATNSNSQTTQQQSPVTTPSSQTNAPLLFAPLSPEQQLQQHLETLQLHTIELDTKIIFTFQYPHFLKKGSNQLQIMIQRRKKYKNRAILGFKTLAVGQINLAEVFANSTNVQQQQQKNVTNLSSTSNLPLNMSTNLQATLTCSQQTAQSESKDTLNSTATGFSAVNSGAGNNATNEPQQQTTAVATGSSTQQNYNLTNSYSMHSELKVDLKCSGMFKKNQSKPHHMNKSQLLMASIVISSICWEPVTHEHRRQKSLDKCVAAANIVREAQQQESEDEEFFNWNEENSDTDGAADQSTSNQQGEQSSSTKQKLNKWRIQMQNSRKARKLFTSLDKNADEHQRNFKQRLVALIRKFRIPDSANFDSPEQYEAALERELMVNVVDNVEDDQDIEDLLAASVNLDEQGDVCLDDLEDLSDYSTQEFDDCLSISSTPKPSLRPFFSTCTLVGPDADDDLKNYVKKHIQEEEVDDVEEEVENAPEEVTDSVGLQPKNKKWNEKRSKLLAKTTNYITMKDRKSLMTIINLLAKHKNRNFLPKESDNNLKKSFSEHLERVFSDESNPNIIPEQISFIQSNEFSFLPTLKEKLSELNHTVIETSTFLEMKTAFNYLINRIQKFCNCNARAPATIRICIFGSDAYVNTVLRAYVEYLSNKSPEWQTYMRFYPIPLCNSGSTTLSLFLGSIDAQYQTNFCNGKWKELFDTQNQANLIQELIGRVKFYLNNSTLTVQIPIADSMIMYKTAQAFIPFICSVKIGFKDKSLKSGNVSIEEDKEPLSTQPSSSPPNQSSTASASSTNKPDLQTVVNSLNNLGFQNSMASTSNGTNLHQNEKESLLNQQSQQQTQSPPNSPGTSNHHQQQGAMIGANSTLGAPFSPTSLQSPSMQANSSQFSNLLNNGSNLVSPESKLKDTLRDREECLDLQIDYWTTSAKQQSTAMQLDSKLDSSFGGSSRKSDINNKTTLKNTFRTLQISRLPSPTENHLTSPSLTLSYLTKEKKQKIMRLGKKKDRDPDNKFQVVEGIHRLVCSYKNSSLKVNLDGVNWTGVKFFQLTAQWQTSIKTFPIALLNVNESCSLQSTCIPKPIRV